MPSELVSASLLPPRSRRRPVSRPTRSRRGERAARSGRRSGDPLRSLAHSGRDGRLRAGGRRGPRSQSAAQAARPRADSRPRAPGSSAADRKRAALRGRRHAGAAPQLRGPDRRRQRRGRRRPRGAARHRGRRRRLALRAGGQPPLRRLRQGDRRSSRSSGPFATNALWAGFGGICETNNDGDPIVLYDDRADPLAGQPVRDRRRRLPVRRGLDHRRPDAAPTTATTSWSAPGAFNDYPKLGVWPDGYYMSRQRLRRQLRRGAIAVAFERAAMLAGSLGARWSSSACPACATECLVRHPAGRTWEGGTPPPAGAPGTFILAWDDETWGAGTGPDGYRLWRVHGQLDDPAAARPSPRCRMCSAASSTAEFCGFSRSCITQPTPGERARRPRPRAAPCTAPSTATSAPTSRWCQPPRSTSPAAAWPACAGPSCATTGGGWALHQDRHLRAADGLQPLDGLDRHGRRRQHRARLQRLGQQPASRRPLRHPRRGRPARARCGRRDDAGRRRRRADGSFNRWGDYSSMSVDPADDCTFWYTQEY